MPLAPDEDGLVPEAFFNGMKGKRLYGMYVSFLHHIQKYSSELPPILNVIKIFLEFPREYIHCTFYCLPNTHSGRVSADFVYILHVFQ